MDGPFQLPDVRLQLRLLARVDVEERIPRALQELGSLAGRRVLLLDTRADGFRARQLRVLGADVTTPGTGSAALAELEDGSFEAVLSTWSGVRGSGPNPARELLEAERLLVAGGRLLTVQDYGRDDVAALWADPGREARLMAWSRRQGPLLAAGFRVRVLHCWWTFRDLEEAAELLEAAFPTTGAAVAAGLRRPRLSYKAAVYYRTAESRRAAA